MPIYAYRCADCGHAKDVLQKLSDAVLTTCPSCGAEAFGKQLTAAGFQLKGSGWYATDFKSSGSAPAKADAPAGGEAKPDAGGAKPDAGGAKADVVAAKPDGKPDGKPAPAASAAAASASPAGSSGSGSGARAGH